MNIGIIGLGLIGGSVLKNLSETKHNLYAVTRNKETLEKIKNITKVCSDDYSILKECDIVFVCTPVHKITETLDKLENILFSDCIVTDVASVKEFVTKRKRPYKFIPSHPMAGTENSGYDASFKELFEGAKWVLTPYDCNETEILTELIKKMGAIPIITTAEEHDKAVAMISHVPMYLSQCLFKKAEENKLAMSLASSGFRDTTRLAMTDINLAKDMLKYNSKNMDNFIDDLILELKAFKENYKDETILEIQKNRKKMYSVDGKNIFK